MALKIGSTLKEVRTRRNLSLSEIAKQSRLSKSYLNKIEIQKISPSINELERICNAINIDIHILMGLASNQYTDRGFWADMKKDLSRD